jgi:hypothetical protein
MEPTQYEKPSGEQVANHTPMKLVYAVVFLLIALSAGFLLYQFRGEERALEVLLEETPQEVVVEYTERDGGVLPPPAGLPSDIPIERDRIIESSVATLTVNQTKQISLSYQSSQTVVAKVQEYRSYMQRAGYEISETPAGSAVRGLFGRKDDAQLSVVVSLTNGSTLVQIAYVVK